MMGEVVHFPAIRRRAWLICLMAPGIYRAELFDFATPRRLAVTECGGHAEVMAAVRQSESWRGLPVIPCWAAEDEAPA